MAKVRVHELAKKHKITSEEVLEILGKAGFQLNSHMSGATDEMVSALENRLAKRKETTRKKPALKKAAKGPPSPRAKAKARPKAPARAKAGKTRVEVVAEGVERRKDRGKRSVSEKTAAKEARVKARPKGGRGARQVELERGPSGKTRAVAVPPRKRGRAERKTTAANFEAQQKAVRESVRRTLAKLEVTRKTKRRKEKVREEEPKGEQLVKVSEPVTLRELAKAFAIDINDAIKRCIELGAPATVNQRLERDIIELLAEDLGKVVEFEADYGESVFKLETDIEPVKLKPRAPIVTVMGHVDHGKTSILDYVRKTNVASCEAGGITQHIGAYEVEASGGRITFIDTPGHEAFTAMRARGASVTDIVVLVVAADDGVMPQTVEALNHARSARVPLVIAINKIDVPAANADRVKQQLMEHKVVVEDFGGDTVCVEVSAKTGEGIEKLLEMIILQAELLELKALEEGAAKGVIIEVRKEEGRGILCTVLVVQGILRVGDVFVTGVHYGKVRALLDCVGYSLSEARPSAPVLVLGCNGLPKAGDSFAVVEDEREARAFSLRRQEIQRERELRSTRKLTLEELYSQIREGSLKEIKLVIKGDTNGSVEAVTESLGALSDEEIKVNVIHSGVGFVTESDVLLAASSSALIIGFNVKASPKAQELAEREGVEVRKYDVIYECISEVKDAMEGMLEPEVVERVVGRAEVRKIFKISKLGTIAGSFVLEGSITRNAPARIMRNGDIVFEGKITSLKRFQDDVKEVQKDFECGIGVSGFNDFQEGDIIETYIVEQKSKIV